MFVHFAARCFRCPLSVFSPISFLSRHAFRMFNDYIKRNLSNMRERSKKSFFTVRGNYKGKERAGKKLGRREER